MADVTRREAEIPAGATRREPPAGEGATRREGAEDSHDRPRSLINLPTVLANRYSVVQEIASRGNEADLLLVEDRTGGRWVAKIYRPGIEPKTEVLDRISRAAPEHVIRLHDHGRDHAHGRAWELLEYAPQGSLTELLRREAQLDLATVQEVLRELRGLGASARARDRAPRSQAG